jgi:hypothetical protein
MNDKLRSLPDWLALVVSVAALATSVFIGVAAIEVSRDTLDIQRKHDELSIKPILEFRYKFGISAVREDSGFLALINVGEGPATITRIVATFDGNPVQTEADSLARISRGLGLISRTLRVDQSIGSGGATTLFGIPARNLRPTEVCPADSARKNFFQQMQIEVEYKSLYNKLDTARFSYRSTNTSGCGRGRRPRGRRRPARRRGAVAKSRTASYLARGLGDANGGSMIQISEFWEDEEFEHPPLTDAMLREAEARLGVTLPSEYVQLLRVRNGGGTREFVFPMPPRASTANEAEDEPLDELFGIVTDPEFVTGANVLETAYYTEEWGLPPGQVLLCGDGHTWISLDYRKGPVPSVVWIDVECDEVIQVASSFAAFLDLLVPMG